MSKKLSQKDIKNGFKNVGLNPNAPYEGVQQLSRRFERCTIYKDVPVLYSTGAATVTQ